MQPKRDAQSAPSGSDKKRARMRDARTIPIQPPLGRAGGSASSGNAGLPAAIEVEKFAQARSFEITAMQRAMKSARESATQRAFQSLPRHLRRRAASHNIRRLPLRLRAKAISETPKDAAKPKKKSRKLMGIKAIKYLKLNRTQVLLKRQRSKIWLETHIWHAKRMHMIEQWGHRIADRPTEKSFRSSYRATIHGSLVHDASYYQYIILKGNEQSLRRLLEAVCDPVEVSPASIRYSKGARECNTTIYKSYPTELLGPISITWDTATPDTSLRQILLRLHPSIAAASYNVLTSTIASINLVDLAASNSTEKLDTTVEGAEGFSIGVTRCEKEFLTFLILGPRSNEVVKSILRPILSTDDATKDAWKKVSSIVGPGALPNGMVFGFEVYDPRLSFPPKLDKSNYAHSREDDDSEELSIKPDEQIAQVLPFWDAVRRKEIRIPTFKKSEIDQRRSKMLIPGSTIPAIQQDDRIPILLTQTSFSSSPSSSTSSNDSPTPITGWTLTIPSGWGMPFFNSLIFASPRPAGLSAISQAHFTSSSPQSFPRDFPGTKSFEEFELRREELEKGYWERKPPAKRSNYANGGVESPWRVGMEEVLRKTAGAREGEGGWCVSRGLLDRVLGALEGKKEGRAERGSVGSIKNPRGQQILDTLLDEISSSFQSSPLSNAPSITASPTESNRGALLRTAMVRVKLIPIHRGIPEDLALIYSVDDTLRTEINERIRRGTGRGEAEEHYAPLPASSLIGRVTTGNFALREGRGQAVGVIPLVSFLRMKRRDGTLVAGSSAVGRGSGKSKGKGKGREAREGGAELLVMFRNRDGEVYRAASLSLL